MALDPPALSADSDSSPRPERRRWRGWVGVSAGLTVCAAAGAMTWAARVFPEAALADALAARLTADSLTALRIPAVAGLAEIAPVTATAGTATADSPAAEQAAVRAFYAARAGAPAWDAAGARRAALTVLARANYDGLPDVETAGLSGLAAATGRPGAPDSLVARLDARLTAAMLRFGDRLGRPRVDARALYGPGWTPATRPPRDARADALALADTLTAHDDVASGLAAWVQSRRPPHHEYHRLQAALGRELILAAQPDLTLRADVMPADSGAAVRRLRARLSVEGLVAREPRKAEAGRFGPDLARAVRRYQARQGVAPTGRVDAATRDALDRRQTSLIPVLALNLERWRWLPDTLGRLHAVVNIPAFEMAVRERRGERWATAFRSAVVVGQPSWPTPVFSDTMETVVFNPTWMMPASIQRESYGRLRPDRALRQPGPGNALGRVKFLFPNPHAVYVHDTPSKWGFARDQRALSHGCVRSGDPRGLAAALLSRTNGWPASRVDSLFAGPWRTREVVLDRVVPVHLVYVTAEADAAGRVTVFDDVYGHDAVLARALGLAAADPAPSLTSRPIAPHARVPAG